MHRQFVHFTEMKPFSEIHERPEAYAVRTDKPMVWLQKLCVKVLNKLGAHAQETLTTYNSIRVFDTTDIVNRIYDRVKYAHYNYNTRITTIVMGADDFAELMNAPEARYFFDFTARGKYGDGRFGEFDIRVVPWMSGIVVLP